ncbi:TPA: 6-hydroxymethylpterin diphosphokinase MptE-like protein, partial [Aeromonas veronii]
NAIQSMMQRHHDYLLYLFMSRDSHLYRVLIGSINYFYANIISLMMAHINDSDDALTENLNVTITILEQFFTDAKHIYASALERHDTAYFIGLNIFK